MSSCEGGRDEIRKTEELLSLVVFPLFCKCQACVAFIALLTVPLKY